MVNNYKKKQSSKKLLDLEFKARACPKRANSMAVGGRRYRNEESEGDSTGDSTGKAKKMKVITAFPC
jgi:hypothetical protein